MRRKEWPKAGKEVVTNLKNSIFAELRWKMWPGVVVGFDSASYAIVMMRFEIPRAQMGHVQQRIASITNLVTVPKTIRSPI